MMNPVISVNMCVHNAEDYLSASIESILKQSLKNFEFIIVEDGSTDNSYNILREYASVDSRIKLFRNESNAGISYSRNRCLEASTGKYIAIQDADDISLPDRFEQQVRFFERPENSCIGYCGGWMEYFGTKVGIAKYPEKYIKELQLSNCMFGHSSVMFRRAIVKDLKLGFNAAYDPAQDYAMQAALIPHVGFYNIQKVLVRYRYHETNISGKHQLMLGKCREIREAQFKELLGKQDLTQQDKKDINDFFVRLQYFDQPTEEEVRYFIKWIDKILENSNCRIHYSDRGLLATFSKYYFKLFLKHSKVNLRLWFAFLTSRYFRPLFTIYSIRDIIFLLRTPR